MSEIKGWLIQDLIFAQRRPGETVKVATYNDVLRAEIVYLLTYSGGGEQREFRVSFSYFATGSEIWEAFRAVFRKRFRRYPDKGRRRRAK